MSAKLNIKAIKTKAAELDITIPRKASPEMAAELLKEYYNETYTEDELGLCGACGYESHESEVTCPYCGTQLGDADANLGSPSEPKSAKKGAAKKRGKAAPKEKEETAIAPPDPALIEECDERLSKIREFRRDLADRAYNIGKELTEIRDKSLFSAKGYKSFAAFCAQELEYTRVMAYNYIELAKLSEEDARLLGVSKAVLLAKASPAKQKKLIEMAKQGKSRAEMTDYLNKGKLKPSQRTDGEEKITILGRVRDGTIICDWLSDATDKPTKRTVKAKHCGIEIVSGINLIIKEADDESGLILHFSKVEEEEEESEAAFEE